ncbi:tyrosine-type recombinase/integrase [Paludisphaera mucosa]|uniref:Tyrosine-type recombinase/integrase n=1 Tax=Paludisphaera mucosa TaxID=3030827 RepID=A0ABT6FLS9_9BACT|nr:tyrosine-type recombinase/integrase [Paludisphaera mucosa]MDG3008441.1 tyrosine-type recombinase/integrase [Paludisphaera mucosa]
MEFELALSERPSQVATAEAGRSLVKWLVAYCHAEVAGAPKTTLQAKKRDFELFLGYFTRTMGSDSIDDWTRSVSLGFVRWLENDANDGRGYAPTSVNRTTATLRRAVRWMEAKRPFLAGNPFERVTDLVTTVPPAKGLSKLQRSRVLAAADKLCALQTQANQQPRRKRALLVVLLETGMRISETLGVEMEQFDGKNFRNVKRKGKRRDDVYLSPEAREALADYFEHERGRGKGTVFQSREGTPMLRKDADRFLKQIQGMANANVPEDEKVNLHAHLMRHTALKQAEQKFGRAFAQRKSGNVGMQHIERYVQPADSDYEEAMDKLYS